jgi:hypothetical protein
VPIVVVDVPVVVPVPIIVVVVVRVRWVGGALGSEVAHTRSMSSFGACETARFTGPSVAQILEVLRVAMAVRVLPAADRLLSKLSGWPP